MANEKRLIDANELTEGLKSLTGMFTDEIGFAVSLESVLWKVDAQPTVDAVEVVRCKDCKHRYTASSGVIFCQQHITVSANNDDFCSYGERKDNG